MSGRFHFGGRQYLATADDTIDLGSRNADVGEKMIVHLIELMDCTATIKVLGYFFAYIHLFSSHELNVCIINRL